ncbi:hypothetical protein VB737_16305, partial [Synechococcus sp. BA-120 BA3]|nr:hypothetical protein [Synechococcus sp. BA-120 BA3]
MSGVLALTAAPVQARPDLPSRLQAAQAQLAPAPAATPGTASTPDPFDDELEPEPPAGAQAGAEPA